MEVRITTGKTVQVLGDIGEAIKGFLGTGTKETLESARDEARTYPAPRGLYHRTQTYYNSFKVEGEGSNTYRLYSDAQQRGRHYTKHVGGDAQGKGQAGMHKGRWPVIYEVVKKHADLLVKQARDKLEDIGRRI